METPASSGVSPDTESDAPSTVDTVVIQDIPNRPEGEYLSVNGIELYCEIFGEGEPLLLIHGGAATIESWFFQIPEFAGKFKVIVPDARGHGRTRDVEGPIDFKNMAADFEALLDHLGITGAMIVGWSDGGVTALQMAMDRPDLVSKVVTLGAHSRPEGMTEQFKAEIEGATPENFPAILSEGYKALSPDGPDHWPVVFGKLKEMWLTLPNFSEEELKSVECPVLLLVGEQDIVRPEESDRLTDLIPDARLVVIEGASHYCPVEVPDVVNGIIMEFLTEE